MTKTFFIIPGFKMRAKDKPFAWLVDFLKSQGFEVKKVLIKWDRTTVTQNAEEFKEFFHKHKGRQNYVLGFSYGAVIALITANSLEPKKIFLCSLSPDFKEDSKNMKGWIKKLIGKNRYKDIQTRSGRKIAQELKVPSVIFYGEKEGKQYPKLKNRCEETVRLAHNSSLVVVKDAPHKIDHPNYIESIKKELNLI